MQEKYSFTGKRLTSQLKHIVMNVVEYFKNEAKKSKGHSNVVERAHRAIGKAWYIVELYFNWLACQGISIASIKRICKESQQEQGISPSPPKRYSKSHIRMDADRFDREAKWRKIHSLYEKRENLTLNKILVCRHVR